ncbi:DUF2188 domain-containing protein [bacterium]|nr:DUF2188 domain-containing protein [bacterium]
MADGKSHHVVPNPNGGWDIRRAGSERSSGHFDVKVDAVGRCRDISRNAGTEMIVHNKNGQFGYRDSHGKDPFPPRG